MGRIQIKNYLLKKCNVQLLINRFWKLRPEVRIADSNLAVTWDTVDTFPIIILPKVSFKPNKTIYYFQIVGLIPFTIV